jgi:hypothetical protein
VFQTILQTTLSDVKGSELRKLPVRCDAPAQTLAKVADYVGRAQPCGYATRSPGGVNQLERLAHIRTLLPPAMTPAPPRLLLFAWNGFTRELTAAAAALDDLEPIDLNRLYAPLHHSTV